MSLNGSQPNFVRCLAVSWTSTLYIDFGRLLSHNGILSRAIFTLRPSLAFAYTVDTSDCLQCLVTLGLYDVNGRVVLRSLGNNDLQNVVLLPVASEPQYCLHDLE